MTIFGEPVYGIVHQMHLSAQILKPAGNHSLLVLGMCALMLPAEGAKRQRDACPCPEGGPCLLLSGSQAAWWRASSGLSLPSCRAEGPDKKHTSRWPSLLLDPLSVSFGKSLCPLFPSSSQLLEPAHLTSGASGAFPLPPPLQAACGPSSHSFYLPSRSSPWASCHFCPTTHLGDPWHCACGTHGASLWVVVDL